jgi:hypothetical protein
MSLNSMFLAAAMVGLCLAGCSSQDDPGVDVNDQRAPSEKVENGTAFDKAALNPGTAKKIVLPDSATVRRTAESGPISLFMAKRLHFGGHPPEPMSIRGARKNMGCAVKAEGETLIIATFGEWDSHKEGGADMKLVVVVPERLEVEKRGGLSGENSAAREWSGTYLTKPAEAKGGYWYGPASPAGGWSAVPDEPDHDRTAK